MNVTPLKVFQAAKWLVENSSLYREEGITFNDTWLETTNALLVNDVLTEDDHWSQSRKPGTSILSVNNISKSQVLIDDEDKNPCKSIILNVFQIANQMTSQSNFT